MQERETLSSMDQKTYLSNLGKNPKLTEEMRKLVESDLQFGLTVAETEEYTSKKYNLTQMEVYSKCLRNGYSMQEKEVIAKEGLSAGQMAVALEFYEKGVPLSILEEVLHDGGRTAYIMKKLLQNVLDKMKKAESTLDLQDSYGKEILDHVKEVMEKISVQEKKYDSLDEMLKGIKTSGQDVTVQNNLLEQLREKDGLLEKQQNEINEARVTIARLRNEMDGVQKEKDLLIRKAKTMEKEIEERKNAMKSRKEAGATVSALLLDAGADHKKAEQMQITKVNDSGMEYHAAVIDENGRILSFLPVEQKKENKEHPAMTAFFSKIFLKKKIDIVKLVAEKNLEPKQLVQIKNGIERGLSENQLLVLINNNLPAEQMEEIIEIAVFENQMKKEG